MLFVLLFHKTILILCIPFSVNVLTTTSFLKSPNNGILSGLIEWEKLRHVFLLPVSWFPLFIQTFWFFSSFFWYLITNLNQNLFLPFIDMFCTIQFIMHLRELVLKISDLSLVLLLLHLHLKKPYQEKSVRIF